MFRLPPPVRASSGDPAGTLPGSLGYARAEGLLPDDTSRRFAVVTGGSNGIGFELARQFFKNGHDVLFAAQDAGHPTEAAQRLSAHGGQLQPHAADP